MEKIVSTTIKGMVKQWAHPKSVKLTAKERKVLLGNGIDARAFVGNRKQKVVYLNEQVALHMRPALTNAQRQKNFSDKFKAENEGNDYYKVRNEYKLMKGNANKKFTKEKAKEIVKAKLKLLVKKRYVGTIDVKFTIEKKDDKSFDKIMKEEDINETDKIILKHIEEVSEESWVRLAKTTSINIVEHLLSILLNKLHKLFHKLK
ncbi:hypothetical protein T484DRAFT_3645231 [Baffinella frigidus]|nr:hypothetical protein T484DRAFT_3645231 [Cryptophyta sp. CCMP2293]